MKTCRCIEQGCEVAHLPECPYFRESVDEDDDGPDPDWIECEECGGEGFYDMSNCCDDLCHGGNVPCMHGYSGRMDCNICHGAGGWKPEPKEPPRCAP